MPQVYATYTRTTAAIMMPHESDTTPNETMWLMQAQIWVDLGQPQNPDHIHTELALDEADAICHLSGNKCKNKPACSKCFRVGSAGCKCTRNGQHLHLLWCLMSESIKEALSNL